MLARILKSAALGVGLALSGLSLPSALVAAHAEVTEPTVAAVRIHADWCGHCKTLDPKLDAAIIGTEALPIKHIRIDYTDRDHARALTELRAAGVDTAVLQAMGGTIATGRLVLVNLETGALIAEFRSAATVEEIRSGLQAAAG
jgi:thiol-disulfide isomerase/thioredoxin